MKRNKRSKENNTKENMKRNKRSKKKIMQVGLHEKLRRLNPNIFIMLCM
jgi:hypothetical protein